MSERTIRFFYDGNRQGHAIEQLLDYAPLGTRWVQIVFLPDGESRCEKLDQLLESLRDDPDPRHLEIGFREGVRPMHCYVMLHATDKVRETIKAIVDQFFLLQMLAKMRREHRRLSAAASSMTGTEIALARAYGRYMADADRHPDVERLDPNF